MENIILKLIELFNPAQMAFFIVLGIIFYFKLKNVFTQQINGLGLRFDGQFGEYKDKNKTEIDLLKERVYKLEVEIQIAKKYQSQQPENI
ncbi:MAG TPA: hypothetical protein DDW90_01605 [Cyanobacteria bacterium UBA9971]|nr:hypothetical protein [Cyanobacteria bacterium UBA9971]